jgi:hypothetical protein
MINMYVIKTTLGRSDRDPTRIPAKTRAYLDSLPATLINTRLPLLNVTLEDDVYVVCALSTDNEKLWFRIPHYRVKLMAHQYSYLVLTSADPIDRLIERLGTFGRWLNAAERKRITKAYGFTATANVLLPMPTQPNSWPHCR